MKQFTVYYVLAAIIGGVVCISPMTTFAYGGGSGGPGWGGSVPRTHLKCYTKIIRLPFGRSVSVPRCAVVHDRDADFNDRVHNFIDRVKNGDHGRPGTH